MNLPFFLMDNQFHEHTGTMQDQPSDLPLSEAGTRQAAAAVGEVAAKINHNAALTLADMRSFAEKLAEAAEVEVGGCRFSLEQLRSDPELRRNIAIWKEILNGEHYRYKELTQLTPSVAAALALYPVDGLFLNGLTSIDPATAEALAQFRGRNIWFDVLTSLDGETAAALAQYRGLNIYLLRLPSLDPTAAAALAQFPGIIFCQPAVHAQIDRYKTPSS